MFFRQEQAPALRSLEGELHDGRLDSVVVCFFREGEPLPYGIQVKCDFCRAVPWYRRFSVFLIVRREQAPALRSLEGELHDGRLDSVVVCFFGRANPSRLLNAYTKTNIQPVILSRGRILGKRYTNRSKDLSAKRNFCCYGGAWTTHISVCFAFGEDPSDVSLHIPIPFSCSG